MDALPCVTTLVDLSAKAIDEQSWRPDQAAHIGNSVGEPRLANGASMRRTGVGWQRRFERGIGDAGQLVSADLIQAAPAHIGTQMPCGRECRWEEGPVAWAFSTHVPAHALAVPLLDVDGFHVRDDQHRSRYCLCPGVTAGNVRDGLLS